MDNHDSLTIRLDSVCAEVDSGDGSLRRILQPLTLQLSESTIAVVGANGSGKSTVLRLIAGLRQPSSGAITFTPDTPRMGFIFANPQAQLVMPVVSEDIEFSLQQIGVPKSQRQSQALEILAEAGLAHRASSSVYDLSSGERQRLALAGVLAVRPSLVLADEPTTLLDLRGAAAFRQRLLELPASLIVATHDLDFAAQADRVLVFDQGQLVADGQAEACIAAYKRLALSQCRP